MPMLIEMKGVEQSPPGGNKEIEMEEPEIPDLDSLEDDMQ